MGGQACILYGASEFSRDSDFVVLPDPANLQRLAEALSDLEAEPVAVPQLGPDVLERGHAVHFRCTHPDVAGLRVDLMSRLRGVDGFADLWNRRTTVTLEDGQTIDLLSLPDLVAAKKTQRDKDWPMIRRLVEADTLSATDAPPERVRFWLREARTPELLARLCGLHPTEAAEIATSRTAVRRALDGDPPGVSEALFIEEQEERRRDAEYWAPLRRELEAMRRTRPRPEEGSQGEGV